MVEIADDYTKRKNVFRVRAANGSSEFLFQVRKGLPRGESAGPNVQVFPQADAEDSMLDWVSAIEDTAAAAAALAVVMVDGGGAAGARAAGLKKLTTSFRNRSPSANSSPATKARKPSAGKYGYKKAVLEVE